MTAFETAILIRFWLGLACLWVLVAFLLRQHAIDKFRQQAFIIRDLLFDLAAENPSSEICFNSVTYKLLRFELNSLIRFAHHINYSEVLAFNLACKLTRAKKQLRHRRANAATVMLIQDPDLRAQVEVMIRTLNWNIVKLCAKTSPLFLILFSCVTLRELLRKLKAGAHLPTCYRPVLIEENEGYPLPISVKKATAQKMRRTHQTVWLESIELSQAEPPPALSFQAATEPVLEYN